MKLKFKVKEAQEMLANKPFVTLSQQFTALCAKDSDEVNAFLDANPEFVQMTMNYANKVVEETEE